MISWTISIRQSFCRDILRTSADNAELWVNNLYRSLPGPEDSNFEDTATTPGRALANRAGSYQTDDPGLIYWITLISREKLRLLERIDGDA